MNSEIIVYIITLICTFFLIYIPIKKYGLSSDLFIKCFYVLIIFYCLIQLIPEIKFIFFLPYSVYSNIFEYIKTGQLLPIGCFRQSDGTVLCL